MTHEFGNLVDAAGDDSSECVLAQEKLETLKSRRIAERDSTWRVNTLTIEVRDLRKTNERIETMD